MAGPTVLVVDDDPDQIALLGHWLRFTNHEVVIAEGGAQAVALLAAGATRFDAVVTDLRMPDVSGLDVLDALAAAWPGTPAIVLSGQGPLDPKDAKRLPAGVKRLTKPLRDLDLLTVAIAEALSQAATGTAAPDRPDRRP